MKRLMYPEITQLIVFDESHINTIVIENKTFFRKMVTSLFQQSKGEDGDFVLSEDYTPIEISKHIELLTQFVPFEINKKGILTKLYTAIEKEAVNESNYMVTQELLSDIERYLDSLLFDFSYGFEYEKLSIGNLIKSVGIVLNEEYENGLEKILDYMQLVREFDREKIFVFVNMRSYYSDESMELFSKEALSRKFKILLIDNVENEQLSNERRLIIDKDLCEIF